MEDFKREDYIYLRALDDFSKTVGFKENVIKKGEIIRYKKEWLLDRLTNKNFNDCLYRAPLVWKKNPNSDENDISFDKIYESIFFNSDWDGPVYLSRKDYLYLDDWLFSHLDQYGLYNVKNLKYEVIPDENNSNKLDKLVKISPGRQVVDTSICLHFKEGEKIDFSTIDVRTLFYDPDFMEFLSHTEVITGLEKEKLFEEDFQNAINVQTYRDYEAGRKDLQEHHYFKIKDGIKLKSLVDIEKATGLSSLYSTFFQFVADENGYITYVCVFTGKFDSSNRDIEQKLLKIADRVPANEALIVHQNACEEYAKKEREANEKYWEEFRIELQKRYEELENEYQKNKNNPEIFPGVNGDFEHYDNTVQTVKEAYTLDQIKEFYQKLKTLNPEIVKHICFYGGTIPYILNDASESRTFGDIDMFVPIKYMEKLRKEFSNQESFKMICDSKPYAKRGRLTTKILNRDYPLSSNEEVILDGDIIDGLYGTNDNLYDNLYYYKYQDFGFKANLFGINISVFPVYEYNNNIMAKSFNIDQKHSFLLGVRILNNTKLEDFVKKVKVYDSIFNILPLEYTIVSKQSAVDGNYSRRYEKDKQDIEYILSHEDALGISDEKLQEIMSNYPDYSISIAYELNGGSVTKMNGETYKELVLTNRNVS